MVEGRDITSEVKRIIKEQLDVDEAQIKPESTFIDDLGADSLGLVELVLAFEAAFEIDIPDEDTEKIRSVQDAIDYIEKHAKKQLVRPGSGAMVRGGLGRRMRREWCERAWLEATFAPWFAMVEGRGAPPRGGPGSRGCAPGRAATHIDERGK